MQSDATEPAATGLLDSGPDGTVLFGVSDVEEFRRYAVAQLRSCAARYPDDPEVAALIAELRAAGALFEDIWQRREVAAEPVLRKTFRHPRSATSRSTATAWTSPTVISS